MENKKRKELQVSAIQNGTVIDHIPAGSVFQAIRILNLERSTEQILFGTNLESKKYGTKGIIKVSNRYFEAEELNKIALVAPRATIIVIKDFQVIEKKRVEVPEKISKFVKCVNPNCITNNESIITKFTVLDKDVINLQCKYCEKITAKDNMVFI